MPGPKFQICPECFSEVHDGARCPGCGTNIEAALRGTDYTSRLIAALGHPLDDVRMRAIIALGARRETQAADPLLALARRTPLDVVQNLEIVNSLHQLPPSPTRTHALRQLAERHPAHAVRVAATRALRHADNE